MKRAETIGDILLDMRVKELELWERKPPRMGAFAAALMLDAFADRLEAAYMKEAAKAICKALNKAERKRKGETNG